MGRGGEGVAAVIWDFGGVFTSSPFEAFNRYEAERGLPHDLIRRINTINPDTNAWARLERSELSPEEFDLVFNEEARALGWRTFRVRSAGSVLLAREFACPASDEEGWRLTCEECLACDGSAGSPDRASPVIVAHGRGRYKLPVV